MLLWLSHVILVDNGHFLTSYDVRMESHDWCCHNNITGLGYVEYEMLVHMATVVRRMCSLSLGENRRVNEWVYLIMWSGLATPTCTECWNVREDHRCEQLLEMGHMSLYYLQYDKAKVTSWYSLYQMMPFFLYCRNISCLLNICCIWRHPWLVCITIDNTRNMDW